MLTAERSVPHSQQPRCLRAAFQRFIDRGIGTHFVVVPVGVLLERKIFAVNVRDHAFAD